MTTDVARCDPQPMNKGLNNGVKCGRISRMSTYVHPDRVLRNAVRLHTNLVKNKTKERFMIPIAVKHHGKLNKTKVQAYMPPSFKVVKVTNFWITVEVNKRFNFAGLSRWD